MKRFVVLVLACLFLSGGQVDAQGKKSEIQKYIKELNAKDAKERLNAVQGIAKIGMLRASYAKDAVAPLCVRIEKDGDGKVRAAAALALGQIDADATKAAPVLIKAVESDKDREVQVNAITALGYLGAGAKEALPLLQKIRTEAGAEAKKYRSEQQAAQKAGDKKKAQEAAQKGRPFQNLCKRPAAPSRRSKPVPSNSLTSPEESNPMKRLVVLGLIGMFLATAYVSELTAQVPNKADMPKFIATAKDAKKDSKERIAALKNIGRLGRLKASYAKDAVEPLIMLVKKEEDSRVRAEAAITLGAIDPEEKEAVSTLIEVLKDEKNDSGVRAAAATGLGSMGAKSKEALPLLREVAKASKKKDKKLGKAAGGAAKAIQGQVKK